MAGRSPRNGRKNVEAGIGTAEGSIKMVALGGGTGLSCLLSGLKQYLRPPDPHISLTAIVTVTDDGKSSGRLREEFAVLPPGDIRNCLTALADEDQLMTRLFRHRFPGDTHVGGHALGNLIILALEQMTGSFLEAIEMAGRLLGVNARVLPSTLENVDLEACIGSHSYRGQVAIKSQNAPITELQLIPPDARALPQSVDAILEADLITIGPGSLFTSVIANLLVEGIRDALVKTKARKIYICNAMTEFDETDGFTAIDHVQCLLAHAPGLKLDHAIFNSAPISEEMRKRYANEGAVALAPPQSHPPGMEEIEFLSLPLASQQIIVRHDPDRLIEAIFHVYSH